MTSTPTSRPKSAPAPVATAPSRAAILAWLLAALLTTTGIWHFASPDGFESIVPHFLGSAAFWVHLSGVGELACAAGLAIRRTRRIAGWVTVALFVVVFPANVTMTIHAVQGHGSEVISWVRLPLQIPLVLWALYIARRTPTSDGRFVPWPWRL